MKNLLLFSFIALLAACGNNQRPQLVEVEAPPPIEEEEQEVAVVNEVVELLVPDAKEKEKYAFLKKELQLEKEKMAAFLSDNKQQSFKPINTVSSQALNKTTQTILDHPIDQFISLSNVDKAAFSKALNLNALTLGYTLIDEFGDSKNKADYTKLESRVNQLIASGVITDTKLIRYKVYEKQLSSSMNSKPGKEGLKVSVDENGTIMINGQRMGKAVEEEGVFYMKIDPSSMMK